MSGERWTITYEGREHAVTVARGRARQRAVWEVDGRAIATLAEHDDKLVLTPEDEEDAALGAVAVKGPVWFGTTRRVVLLPASGVVPEDDDEDEEDDEDEDEDFSDDPRQAARLQLMLNLDRGTLDLVPEAGSKAARRQEWIGRHPHLHLVREILGAGGGVLVPLLLVGVVIPILDQFMPEGPDIEAPDIPFPDLPSIPWPDLPTIPWPTIPWPDLPDWVGTVLKLVAAVTFAFIVARGEVKRRREQAATRAEENATAPEESKTPPGPDAA